MPELPEVERARSDLEVVGKGKTISRVQVWEDTIIYSGTPSSEYPGLMEGKKVVDVRRKGKNFYMVLSSGPTPIFHFGMNGIARIKGSDSPIYKASKTRLTDPNEWPPKYVKMVVTFTNDDGSVHGEWAYTDSRRLGRIKMVDAEDVEAVPPLSLLGSDPLLAMPDIERLSQALLKRKAPIKAVLLDQNGPLCGIGNWVVDEVLFQSRIHPAQRSSSLSEDQLHTLHHQVSEVVRIAVEAKADSKLFPKTWIFSSRWSKAKRGGKSIVLESGAEEPITFLTVGGRTSAVVEAVQSLPSDQTIAAPIKRKAKGEVESTPARKKAKVSRKASDEDVRELDSESGDSDSSLEESKPHTTRGGREDVKNEDDSSAGEATPQNRKVNEGKASVRHNHRPSRSSPRK